MASKTFRPPDECPIHKDLHIVAFLVRSSFERAIDCPVCNERVTKPCLACREEHGISAIRCTQNPDIPIDGYAAEKIHWEKVCKENNKEIYRPTNDAIKIILGSFAALMGLCLAVLMHLCIIPLLTLEIIVIFAMCGLGIGTIRQKMKSDQIKTELFAKQEFKYLKL